ncbi:MAG: hypothetical protein PHF35_01715 [Candidatus Moranbacteria bacterium]|nr:hypothetical protein [Candidatus Moranbacteria bacterium]
MTKILFIIIASFVFSAKQVFAVCPVCTVAVGAGLGLAEWLGIDDSISGLWIGALIVSMSVWTITWLDKKNIRFKGRKIAVFAAYYAIILIPLWLKGKIGHPFHQICGIDKLLFGITLGSLLLALGTFIHVFTRKKNDGKSFFQGQKIVFAILPIIIASLLLYYTC